jgi:hypothetical protein
MNIPHHLSSFIGWSAMSNTDPCPGFSKVIPGERKLVRDTVERHGSELDNGLNVRDISTKYRPLPRSLEI